MPMQPSPIAETSKLLFPSLRFCIFLTPPFKVRRNLLGSCVVIAPVLARPVAILLKTRISGGTVFPEIGPRVDSNGTRIITAALNCNALRPGHRENGITFAVRVNGLGSVYF
jgi:hypothetical protein